jgi:hypothetical protein
MIVPVYCAPPAMPINTLTWQARASVSTTVTASPIETPDPRVNTYAAETAILKPHDPFERLRAEQRKRLSKKSRKAKRPPWRR